jgi:hypothetical protein
MQPKATILLAELHFNGGSSLKRFATHQWYSKQTDSIGVKAFAGRISGEPTYATRVGCVVWGDAPSTSFGALDLVNTDGALTDLTRLGARGNLCVLRLVDDGDGYDDSVVVARCIIDRLEQLDDSIRVILRGMDSRLDRPLQPVLFDDTTPNVSVRQQPLPVAIGIALQVEPTMYAAGFSSGSYITHAATPTDTSLSRPQDIDYGSNTPQWTMTSNPTLGTVSGQAAFGWGTTSPGTYTWASPDIDLRDFRGAFGLIPEEGQVTGFEIHAEVGIGIVDPGQDSGSAWVNEGTASMLSLSGATDTKTVTLPTPGSGVQTVIFGGMNDKWGATTVSRNSFANAALGVRFKFAPKITLASPSTYNIYRTYFLRTIRLRVYYAVSAADYRVSDSYVEVEQVFAGGSEARPPDHEQPQWQPNDQDTGFSMLVQPASRITAHVRGPTAEYADLLDGYGKFFDPDVWTGGVPDGWTVTGAGDAIEMPDIGVLAGAVTLTTSTNVLPDTLAGWYMVAGSIPYTDDGVITLSFRGGVTTHELTVSGEFCIPVYVDADADRTFAVEFAEASPGSTDYAVVRSLYLYKMEDIGVGNYARAALWHILTRGGVLEDSFDPSTLLPPGLSGILSPQVGFYDRGGITARQALNMLAASWTGWTFIAPDGSVRVGQLHEPTAAEVIRISRLNLASYPIWQPDLAPKLSDTYGAHRNWSPYSEQELAGITYEDRQPFMADYRTKVQGTGRLHRFYRHAVGAEPIGTLLMSDTAAQAEADRVTSLYATQRGFWTFGLCLRTPQEAAALQPNAVVLLDDPLFGPSPVKALVLACEGRYRNNTVSLTVWR